MNIWSSPGLISLALWANRLFGLAESLLFPHFPPVSLIDRSQPKTLRHVPLGGVSALSAYLKSCILQTTCLDSLNFQRMGPEERPGAHSSRWVDASRPSFHVLVWGHFSVHIFGFARRACFPLEYSNAIRSL
ncbi:hypothetical protein VTL71DRAFT_5511 [Oculimacula yallundae]|uniref:Secreted protein n=1 Tax=Oculimacula yallundae TaxID=86028 RepID=A0ABR4C2V7_9HELO